VITGPESGAAIEAWLEQNPEQSLEHVVVAEPRRTSMMKRHRIGEFLLYLAWQRRAEKMGRALVESGDFDVAVHATLSAFWLPSVAVDVGLPSMWGPVGGAVTTPVKLWPLLGWKGIASEIMDWLAVRLMSLLPATRRTWRRATVRVVQNEETRRRLPRDLQSDTVVMNHAIFHEVSFEEPDGEQDHEGGRVVWVSPMDSRKGPELAVRALAKTHPSVHMIMAGDGPERIRIETMARTLGLADRISFEGMVSHEQALQIIREADVALFTGLREEGGLALSEAMLLGTPVVVLANGGAATIARSSIDASRVSLVEPAEMSDTIANMAAAIEHQIEQAFSASVESRRPLIDQDASIEDLARLIAHSADRQIGG
jgi:glycosyltransferase involved in cell wall biosynthesis